ncbi:MAG: bacillithiol biosynthesis deacetylase BshB1 [Candidatus Aminicenantes bacterium]|nr:bacillithiol biosynthesis deacetylase BshB1 [Candidatus Aminicenantes bacterium]
MDLDVLAFGAHADDVEITCGATIIKLAALGYKTGIITLTRGEMATRGTPEIRAEEFKKSAEIMGLAAHKMLDIPDGRVEVTWENKLKIIAEIRAHKPRIIFAPYWVERHPDHEKTSHLVRESAYLSGLKKIDTGQDAFRPLRVVFYQSRFEFTPSFVIDTSGFTGRKMSAIMAYASQFHRPDRAGSGSEETSISRPEFLDNIEIRDRRYGLQIGAKYGEPFLVRETLKVEDPVAFFGQESIWTIP